MSLGLEEVSKRIAVGNDSGCEHLQGELVPLEQFSYDNPKMGCVLQESIASVKFNGITVSNYILLPLPYFHYTLTFIGTF